jgi:hypothetical protein
MMMADKGETFKKVLKGLNSTKGASNAERAEQDKRKVKGEDQASHERKRRAVQKRIKDRRNGDDGVIDTGMFGS